jgi:hypothetical protein
MFRREISTPGTRYEKIRKSLAGGFVFLVTPVTHFRKVRLP